MKSSGLFASIREDLQYCGQADGDYHPISVATQVVQIAA